MGEADLGGNIAAPRAEITTLGKMSHRALPEALEARCRGCRVAHCGALGLADNLGRCRDDDVRTGFLQFRLTTVAPQDAD
jgi:hypothetical protein